MTLRRNRGCRLCRYGCNSVIEEEFNELVAGKGASAVFVELTINDSGTVKSYQAQAAAPAILMLRLQPNTWAMTG